MCSVPSDHFLGREHIKRRRQLIVEAPRVGGFKEGPIAADMQSGRGTFYFKRSRVHLFLSVAGSLIISSHLRTTCAHPQLFNLNFNWR